MSSPGSSPVTEAPSDSAVEAALLEAINHCYARNALEDLTVKRIRNAAERELGLEKDFLKENAAWKKRSADIITAAVDARDTNNAGNGAASSPKTGASSSEKPASKPKAQGSMRTSNEQSKLRKGRKEDTDNTAVDQKEAKTSPSNRKAPVKPSKASPATAGAESSEIYKLKDSVPADSDSEMSVLIDEEPKKKKRRQKSESTKAPKSESKSKVPVEQPSDPDQEEIKRLQGWLVKCGIRKMWFKELAPYETSKEKIRHLKDMLSEAGMTGRYSQEKANQIRETRELKADLEAVQEGNKQWGTTGSEDEDAPEGGRPRRRLAKGLQELAFLDDGEETD